MAVWKVDASVGDWVVKWVALEAMMLGMRKVY